MHTRHSRTRAGLLLSCWIGPHVLALAGCTPATRDFAGENEIGGGAPGEGGGGAVQRSWCDDMILNGDETDIDCGGVSCAPCVIGKACSVGADCESGGCDDGVCIDQVSCFGVRIRRIELRYGAEIYGTLDVYFNNAAGTNCAITRASQSTAGRATWMLVELTRCAETSEGPLCTEVIRVSDSGPYRFYTDPVSLRAAETCIRARGEITYDGYTATGETSAGASHCE